MYVEEVTEMKVQSCRGGVSGFGLWRYNNDGRRVGDGSGDGTWL